MKIKPILFSTPMVQAILDGRKKQTRRIIKGFPTSDEAVNLKDIFEHNADYVLAQSPYGIVGDILWVRETFQKYRDGFQYKADGITTTRKWKPSIFMPKEACRIFLEVTDVRVERLQDLSEEDAVREGVEIIHLAEPHVPIYRNYLIKEKLGTTNPKKSFQSLWKSINGKESWNHNPWVWVYDFKRVERPENFLQKSNA